METDLLSVFSVSKRVVGKMIEGRSRNIINICSMMSEYRRNQVLAYAAAKAGLKMLTKNMCVERAKYNVQDNELARVY
ncbi:MAG: SDR family NAD(P)-dependent oxidoreductase [Acidobacterium ailaaui]|nr:SDR family NAD(P)-dependent oxidoreductase [Pseudacidobacterium ailaaui]